MNHMLPTFKHWMITAIALALAAALPFAVHYLHVTPPVETAENDQPADGPDDTMVEMPPATESQTFVSVTLAVSPPLADVRTSDQPQHQPSPDFTRDQPQRDRIAGRDGGMPATRTESSDNITADNREAIDTVSLERALPTAEAAQFLQLRQEGIALRQSAVDGRVPSYFADIPPQLIDAWVARGLARLVVVVRHPEGTVNGIYSFDGRLAFPGRGRLIVHTSELSGFSTRYIALSATQGDRLLQGVPVSRGTTLRVTPGILIRADLDAVVLAMQQRAARELKLSLDQITMTYGRFKIVNGLPFTYEVDRVHTADNRVLPAAPVAVPSTHG